MNVSALLRSPPPRMAREKADQQIKKLQSELERLQQEAWVKGRRTVVVLEGFDAAGKGGCIRHLTARLDPRNCTVVPVGAPNEEERGQHYLQRFWKRLPGAGHLVVYDRSWYGRVLVEKLERLAPPARLAAAYREINQFEKMLRDDGMTVVKLFLVVSKKEQLKRFRERMADPLKRWKITEEDWRNRRKWADYVKASDVLLRRCPGWQVISSDDKDHARVAVLRAVVKAMKQAKGAR